MREAVSLFARFYERPRPVEETIELVGLGDKRDARVGTLSGGQKRRADVAIGIVGDPDLIFLDEPTTGFDPTARRDAWNMIEGLKALGKTVFLTTHYMDEAQHLADRVAILRDGRIVAQGRTEELGESLGRRTVIGFSLNGGLGIEDVRARRLGARSQVSGNQVEIETEQPQADLYRLLSLAEERGADARGARGPPSQPRGHLPRADPRGGASERPRHRPRPGADGDPGRPAHAADVIFTVAFPLVLLVLFNSLFNHGGTTRRRCPTASCSAPRPTSPPGSSPTRSPSPPSPRSPSR